MIPSQKAIDLIKKFEGFKNKSYLCPAGMPTIGYGSTMWTDGRRVRLGQVISLQDAEKLVSYHLANVIHFIPDNLTQNQFDALSSFIYNVGVANFRKSTLLKKVNENPDDVSIRDEFMKWTLARKNGQLVQLPGLVKRRKAEADLYYEES
ncbi:MAG: lysozyme [Bacteroidota bacterium]